MDLSGSHPGEEPGDEEPPERLAVDFVIDQGDWSALADPERLVRAAADALADLCTPKTAHGLPALACVALSSDAVVREMNRAWRGKDKATNVLSFPSEQAPAPGAAAHFIGDVVLADATVAAEAGAQQIPLANHVQHLVVHGLLHLLGYDHECEDDAARMEALETQVLQRLGIPDPYAPLD